MANEKEAHGPTPTRIIARESCSRGMASGSARSAGVGGGDAVNEEQIELVIVPVRDPREWFWWEFTTGAMIL